MMTLYIYIYIEIRCVSSSPTNILKELVLMFKLHL